MRQFDSIDHIAREYNEINLTKAVSFDSSVYLGQSFIFKIRGTDPNKHSKENRVLDYLNRHGSSDLINFLPVIVEEAILPDGRLVTVQNKISGDKYTKLSQSMARQVAEALNLLHSVPSPDKVTEFEQQTWTTFSEYVSELSGKYVEKLSGLVDLNDLNLACKAKERIDREINWFDEAPLVLVHKDIYLDNLLFSDSNLVAIIDWDAAQTAPVEWEFSILKQRFPQIYHDFYNACGVQLLESGIDLCGLIQALRFWKSFPDDPIFADIQRKTIIRTISG